METQFAVGSSELFIVSFIIDTFVAGIVRWAVAPGPEPVYRPRSVGLTRHALVPKVAFESISIHEFFPSLSI
ncbi:MAG: hypothetical protein OJF51_001649 [Nitrospira sp.]|nr:MAG: hypothetical protein OJF51_001649 [Nitrospira sp.]